MTSKSNQKDFIISDIWDKWILFKKNNNITIGRITKGNTNRVNILIKCQLRIRINNDTFFMFIKNTSQQLRKLNSSKRKEYLTRPLRCKFVLMKGRKLKSKKRDSNGRFVSSKIIHKNHKKEFFFDFEKKNSNKKEKINADYIDDIVYMLKKGLSYNQLSRFVDFSERTYYQEICKLNNLFLNFIQKKIITILKKYQKRQIVIGYDGRWCSRRYGRECTVSLIIIDGIKELKNKVIFSASMKTSEDENSQFAPFYFEKKIHSSLMEGYLLHQSFCFLKKFGLNLVGIVHDLDLKSFGIIKNIYGEEIKEYFDINHFFKFYQRQFENWRKSKEQIKLNVLLRCFSFSRQFSKRWTDWLKNCLKTYPNNSNDFQKNGIYIF
ncbi:hypothetical protein M0813_16138 [Anaeramoeba flamelloides]|uniref:Uncharacterized protein n=1 Tax=Anaeramoeba flamelloides TaxID=1746091 RepID=A0ABQ8Z0M9_9EUKA|nr:hypothetical protein M0813_16138 [Anaeramoeba flamelloides]